MKKLSLLGGLLWLLAFSATAQVSGGGQPFSFNNVLPDNFRNTKVVMPVLDVPALQKQAREAFAKGEMLPAGKYSQFPIHLKTAVAGLRCLTMTVYGVYW